MTSVKWGLIFNIENDFSLLKLNFQHWKLNFTSVKQNFMFKIENYTLLQEFDNMIPYSKNVEKKYFHIFKTKMSLSFMCKWSNKKWANCLSFSLSKINKLAKFAILSKFVLLAIFANFGVLDKLTYCLV